MRSAEPTAAGGSVAVDCEIALIGTGAAPLIAAAYLLAQGRRVLVLNPDRDFFLEDSELPLDPLLPVVGEVSPGAIRRSEPERALAALRPHFPGAVEFWPPNSPARAGFRDSGAPHIRQRARLWVSSAPRAPELDDLYLRALEGGLAPKLLEGLQASSRFPGATSRTSVDKGVFVAKSCDVDVNRYRIGLLEFVRERLGARGLACGAHPIELVPGGLRWGNGAGHAKVSERAIVYWTPRLTSWLLAQAKEAEVPDADRRMPEGVRLWEHWTLMSRDPIDPGVIGHFSDMVVWAEFEGLPEPGPGKSARRLSVLRAGERQALKAYFSPQSQLRGPGWASAGSFESVAALSGDLLRWSGFSVRSMRPRASFEWKSEEPADSRWELRGAPLPVRVVGGCEGALSSVALAARLSCEDAAAAAEAEP
jgi:hypothetical protein